MTDIYEQHKHALYMYALKMTKSTEMAEDAVHDAFLSIIKHKDRYLCLSHNDFRRLAITIVKSKCIDLLRKQEPYSDIPFEELEIYLESNEESALDQIIAASTRDELRKHLNAIDEISHQVLIMKYFFEMSYKEIGEKLNMTAKHVDTRIMRAKEKVRKLFAMEVDYER